MAMQVVTLPSVMPRMAHAAGPWFVSSTNGAASDSSGCGTTSALPCRTINHVLKNLSGVQPGDTVLLEGAFTEVLVITRSVVLSGQGAGLTSINGNSSRVISVTAGVQLTLNGLTVRNGSGVAEGSGIFNAGALTVIDSTIADNTADFGGGLYNAAGATAILTDTLVTENRVTNFGAGIYNAGQLVGKGVTLAANVADEIVGVGGGIHNVGSLSLTDATLTANRGVYGAGINNENGGKMHLLRVVAKGNIGLLGGALSNYAPGSVAVDESAFTSNIAPNAGGGIYNTGALVITNTTFSGNQSAGGFGAGIDNDAASAFASLTNVSVISNTAVGAGVASGLRASTGSRVEITNTIVAFNHGDNCFADGGAVVSFGNNLSNDAGCETFTQPSDRSNTDPKVGPLQLVSATYIHPLRRTSPAIDAVFSGPCPARDQRGVARPQDVRCDIGAVEAVPIDLGITASASPPSVILGNGYAYVAEVVNTGATDATGVSITGTIPAGASVMNCAASQGACDVSAGQLSAAMGSLAPGAKATVTLQMTPLVTGQIPMTFHASGNETDVNVGDDTATAQVTVGTDADLRITGSASPEAKLGQQFTVTVQVDDLGPGTAVNPSVEITLPVNTAFVSAAGTNWTCNAASNGVTCAWQPLLLTVGVAPSITITARAPLSQQATRVTANVTMSVHASSNDPNSSNKEASASITFVRDFSAYLSLLRKQ
jgi:uncharacterized repeat protein (TIGR01451 family)